MRWNTEWVILLGAVAASGCGGEVSGGGATCSGSPCGGDIVGRWNIVRSCTSTSPVLMGAGGATNLPPECAGIVRSTNLSITGTYDFRSDGTLTIDTSGGASIVEVMSDACMSALGAPQPHDQACSSIGNSIGQGSSTLTASCTYSSPTGCTCNLELPSQARTNQVTYTTQGTQLDYGTGARLEYCVQKGQPRTLTVFTTSSAQVSETLVLQEAN